MTFMTMMSVSKLPNTTLHTYIISPKDHQQQYLLRSLVKIFYFLLPVCSIFAIVNKLTKTFQYLKKKTFCNTVVVSRADIVSGKRNILLCSSKCFYICECVCLCACLLLVNILVQVLSPASLFCSHLVSATLTSAPLFSVILCLIPSHTSQICRLSLYSTPTPQVSVQCASA